jgi:hypothetical protein
LAFVQALEKHVALPCDGFVIGGTVSVVKFDYQGYQLRGLTANGSVTIFRRRHTRGRMPASNQIAIWNSPAMKWSWRTI